MKEINSTDLVYFTLDFECKHVQLTRVRYRLMEITRIRESFVGEKLKCEQCHAAKKVVGVRLSQAAECMEDIKRGFAEG